VLGDDPEKTEIVRWLFRSYDQLDIGLRQLASDLNARGVPSPRGKTWCVGTVTAILRNEAYCGDFVWNKRRQGKYHSVSVDEIQERPQHERTASPNFSGLKKSQSA
jgi:hypothetical protein